MLRQPPSSPRPDTPFPTPTLFRSTGRAAAVAGLTLAAPRLARADADTLAQIKQRGSLRVGVTQAPPWYSKDPKTGEWSSGVGVSLGKAMARALGVKLDRKSTRLNSSH